jgi:hypothetical protein
MSRFGKINRNLIEINLIRYLSRLLSILIINGIIIS